MMYRENVKINGGFSGFPIGGVARFQHINSTHTTSVICNYFRAMDFSHSSIDFPFIRFSLIYRRRYSREQLNSFLVFPFDLRCLVCINCPSESSSIHFLIAFQASFCLSVQFHMREFDFLVKKGKWQL